MNDDTPLNDSVIRFSARLSWGLAGPLALFFLAAYILRDKHPPLSVPSLLYFGVLILTLVMRLFDIEFLEGTTLTGRPATFKHWTRYAVVTSLAAALAWGAVQYIALSQRIPQESGESRLESAW